MADHADAGKQGYLKEPFRLFHLKDRLAQEMEADILMILTEVPAVAIHFGKPNQENLGHVTAGQLEEYAAQGQFGAGSMLPKVQAAIDFVRPAPNRTALITSLDLGLEALSGRAGTKVTA